MKDKKLLIIGAGGMLGYAVHEHFSRADFEVTAIDRSHFDIALQSIDAIYEQVKSSDLVINCAGVIKPRIAETPIENVLKVNGVFPINLAKVCATLDKMLFHFTTDCVYSGKKGRYVESDLFDAEDVYGLSKNFGDFAECMVLRTSIIGPEKGQSRSLLEWAFSQRGQTVNGFTDHLWNGITTLQAAKVVQKILEQGYYERGIHHVHSPRAVSKFELIEIINSSYGLGLKIEAKDSGEACDRTLTSERPLVGALNIPDIVDQVSSMRDVFATA